MFVSQVQNIAGDFQHTTRWALVNLTGDDANAENRQLLSQRRIVGIGSKYVRLMSAAGEIIPVDPHLIQSVW